MMPTSLTNESNSTINPNADRSLQTMQPTSASKNDNTGGDKDVNMQVTSNNVRDDYIEMADTFSPEDKKMSGLNSLLIAAMRHADETTEAPGTVVSLEPMQGREPQTGRGDLDGPSPVTSADFFDKKLESNTLPVSSGEAAISHVGEHDVLLGRGGETNHNAGNKSYRALVRKHQMMYIEAKRQEKAQMSQMIVDIIRKRGGRFLKKQADGTWKDVGNSKAREKTSQTFREGAPQLRKAARGPRIKLLKSRVKATVTASKRSASSPPSEHLLLEHFRKCEQPSCKACVPVREALRILYSNSREAVQTKKTVLKSGDKRVMPPMFNGASVNNSKDVSAPTSVDVIYGKGRAIQDHVGNYRFRSIIKSYQPMYQDAQSRAVKTEISKHVVQEIRACGGRFLQRDAAQGTYHDVGDECARDKVSHALRASTKGAS